MAAWAEPPTAYGERAKPAADAAPVRRAVTSRSAIALTDLTPNNLGQLRMLNAQLFPIAYSENVYTQVLDEDVRPLCKLGLYNDITVGNVCCRVDDGKDVAHCRVYIMTLGVLPAYRHLGIASALLQQVLEHAAPGTKFNGRTVEVVSLHVHTANTAARAFYERFGFEAVHTEPEYYKKLEPRSAWVLEKRA
ncbi:N-terminal methionine N(alpha)-acetyltransferase NatE [Malassezia obtusa]|uniref:N-terminal methionine N(alpha)-acetyltransferase NatE n=1 Tax=Malassezia obtusa TaxID=76774 RepID=A0AAF0ITC4_9BASI|nr:N-terminal methionine N(alpha)-acetyltransferase NatE [Malassezia obtusa]